MSSTGGAGQIESLSSAVSEGISGFNISDIEGELCTQRKNLHFSYYFQLSPYRIEQVAMLVGRQRIWWFHCTMR